MNRSNSTLWGAGALVFAGIVVVIVGARFFEQPELSSSVATPATGSRGDERVRALEEQLAALSRQQEAISAHSAQPAGEGSAQDIEDLHQRIDELSQWLAEAEARREMALQSAENLRASANDPEVRQRYLNYVQEQKTRQQAQIAAQFFAEEVDDDWAPEMAAEIVSAFNAPELTAANLESSDCRSSMCRVEVTANLNTNEAFGDSDVGFEDEMVAELMRNLPTGTMKREPYAGGYRYTLHLYRPGHKPPPATDLSGMNLEEIKAIIGAQ
jgi:hypothetical protein